MLKNLICLIAGNDLPDIIEYNWYTYTGGPERALSEGLIRAIDIETEAPNLYAYLQQHPEIDKMCKTDDGQYFGFPFIRGDKYLQTSAGIIIRQDWLDELGLAMPETIDDWTNVLTQFKEQKGARATAFHYNSVVWNIVFSIYWCIRNNR